MNKLLFLLLFLPVLASAQHRTVMDASGPIPAPHVAFSAKYPMYLQDASDACWGVTVQDIGTITLTSSSRSCSATYQVNSWPDESTWLLGVSASFLAVSSQNFSALHPSQLYFTTQSGSKAYLTSLQGSLSLVVGN